MFFRIYSANPLNVLVYGVSPSFVVSAGTSNSNSGVISYLVGSSYIPIANGAGVNNWCTSSNCIQSSGYGSSGVKLIFQNGDDFFQYYVQNQNDKTLKNTEDTAIKTDPITYYPLIKNEGIYIYDPQTSDGSKWICFQGDGELHVTVEPEGTPSKYYYSLSDGGNSSEQDITGTDKTIIIPSSAFRQENGQYVATVYFRNAFVKSLTQEASSRTRYILESTISPSENYPLVYSYEKQDGSIETITTTSMDYDSTKEKYCLDIPPMCLPKYAAIKFSKTEIVSDLIEFSNASSKNGRIKATSFNGSNSNDFYTISSSSTGRLSISDQGTIELTVAPKFDVNNGTIKLGSGAEKTISKQETFTIQSSEMTNGGVGYYVDVTCNNLILIKAKYSDQPGDISFPYEMERTQILDWKNQSMSTALNIVGSNISMSGSYNNYYSSDKYHRLNTSLCSPTVQNTKFASDISALIEVRADTDDKTKMFLKWYMPEYSYENDSTHFTGAVRLFSPITRDSVRNYCQIQPYSTSYNDMANIFAHSFTTPHNSVLALNGYQEANDTPTEAVEKVTADVCSKLKAEHGNNLRIYLIEYRKQEKYKTFPTGETKKHSYSTIENYADRKYEVNSKEELVSTLKTIADDIKKADFAGYMDAMEC